MQVDQVQAPVYYLERDTSRSWKNLFRENIRVARLHLRGYLSSLLYIAANKEIDEGYTASSRWECFLQAVHFVFILDQKQRNREKTIDHLHAHFAHDPALIAYLVNRMTGLRYSFTAHARDLFQVPEKHLKDRISRAQAVVTCCQANLDYLYQIVPSQTLKTSLIYHGVNLNDFQPAAAMETKLSPACPLILSVGRLVEKKGFQDLLQALFLVKQQGVAFECAIYGEGPLAPQLQRWIEEHGMTGEVTLKGARSQQELISVYPRAALFVLTPIQTEDGDRDGIPNVLVEAMAVGLPVITTAVSGIPELVDHDQNGFLYQPHDVEGISSGIVDLLRNPAKRKQFGSTASKKVMEQFDITQAAKRLKTLFI